MQIIVKTYFVSLYILKDAYYDPFQIVRLYHKANIRNSRMTASQKKKRVTFTLPSSESDTSDESDSNSDSERTVKSNRKTKKSPPRKDPPVGDIPTKSILKKTRPVYQQVVQPSFLPLSVINSVINSVGGGTLLTPDLECDTNVFEEDFKDSSTLSSLKEEPEEDKENKPIVDQKAPDEESKTDTIISEKSVLEDREVSQDTKQSLNSSLIENNPVHNGDLINNQVESSGQEGTEEKPFQSDRLKNSGLFSPVPVRKNKFHTLTKVSDNNLLNKKPDSAHNQILNSTNNKSSSKFTDTSVAKTSQNTFNNRSNNTIANNKLGETTSKSDQALRKNSNKFNKENSQLENSNAVNSSCEQNSSGFLSKLREKKRKTQRKPFKMPQVANPDSGNLNCAGEPDSITPAMRDDIKEKDILIWIYNMIDEPARVDFEFFLKDGCIICKLMNRIKPGSIPENEITWEGARSKQKNIKMFLDAAESYGVPKAKLFHMEDLLHLRHIPRVTRCIYALAKLAQDDPSIPDCPRLGDEPNFVTATKKEYVPGHRDTKDVMNQLSSSMQKKEEKKSAGKHSLYK